MTVSNCDHFMQPTFLDGHDRYCLKCKQQLTDNQLSVMALKAILHYIDELAKKQGVDIGQ